MGCYSRGDKMETIRSVVKVFTSLFVVWVTVVSVFAYFYPSVFTWIKPYIEPGLGMIMFGMGMTLIPADFTRVMRMPRAVICGIFGQFLIMPLIAVALVNIFRLDNELAMGFIILGCCPGGLASNVIAYLSKADVALSVTMTAISTILAVVLTPVLIQFYGGHFLPVDAWKLFISVVKIVLAPVLLGITIRYCLGDSTRTFLEIFPAISVTTIVILCAAIIALSKDDIQAAFGIAALLVILHNAFGLAFGYSLAKLFRLPETACRTVAVEVGMQNSGLGMTLAATHFTSLSALPCSLFSVWHNISGSALATFWSRREPADYIEPADALATNEDEGDE